MGPDSNKLELSIPSINGLVEPVSDKESQKLASKDVDGALAFLQNEADTNIVDVNEKQLLRKIDWLLMPLLFGVYTLQYTDKSLSKSHQHDMPVLVTPCKT